MPRIRASLVRCLLEAPVNKTCPVRSLSTGSSTPTISSSWYTFEFLSSSNRLHTANHIRLVRAINLRILAARQITHSDPRRSDWRTFKPRSYPSAFPSQSQCPVDLQVLQYRQSTALQCPSRHTILFPKGNFRPSIWRTACPVIHIRLRALLLPTPVTPHRTRQGRCSILPFRSLLTLTPLHPRPSLLLDMPRPSGHQTVPSPQPIHHLRQRMDKFVIAPHLDRSLPLSSRSALEGPSMSRTLRSLTLHQWLGS